MNNPGEKRQYTFSELIAHHQSDLFGYIYAVVRNWEDSDDLFQTVCLVLWRKFDSFRPGSDFFRWARQVAKFEVSNYLRRKHLQSYVTDELLEALTDVDVDSPDDEKDQYLAALRRCREKLGTSDAELLELHYVENLGSRQIADQLQRSQSSVCNSLNRIRSQLFKCIQVDMTQQEHRGKRRCP